MINKTKWYKMSFNFCCPQTGAPILRYIHYVYYIMIIFLTSLTSCFSGLNVLFNRPSMHWMKTFEKAQDRGSHFWKRPQQWNLGMPPLAPNMAPKTGHPTMAPSHGYLNMAHSQAPKHGTTLSKRCNPHAHTIGNRNPTAASISIRGSRLRTTTCAFGRLGARETGRSWSLGTATKLVWNFRHKFMKYQSKGSWLWS